MYDECQNKLMLEREGCAKNLCKITLGCDKSFFKNRAIVRTPPTIDSSIGMPGGSVGAYGVPGGSVGAPWGPMEYLGAP